MVFDLFATGQESFSTWSLPLPPFKFQPEILPTTNEQDSTASHPDAAVKRVRGLCAWDLRAHSREKLPRKRSRGGVDVLSSRAQD